MKIEIFGTGCAKCRKLYENTLEAVRQAGISAEVIKVEDINAITAAGVMMTPAIAVDGSVKNSGKVLKVEQIRELIA